MQQTQSEAVIGNWLVGPVHRATGWVAASGLTIYSIPLILQTLATPASWATDLPRWAITVAAIVLIARRASRGLSPAKPVRVAVLVALISRIVHWVAIEQGMLAPSDYPTDQLFSWVALAIVVIGWPSTWSVLVAGALVVTDVLVSQPPTVGAAVWGLVFGMGLYAATSFAALGLRRSLRRRTGRVLAAHESLARAEEAASAVHQHGYWAGVVHDHVLSVLVAAGQAKDEASRDWLARDAATALERLGQRPETLPCLTGELATWILQAARDAVPGIEFHERLADRGRSLPGEVAAALLTASEEALRNVVRHGDPDSASVSLVQEDDELTVTVRDEGVGFDPASVPGSRLGLRVAVAERLAMVGGQGTWISSPGAGATVRLRWPA